MRGTNPLRQHAQRIISVGNPNDLRRGARRKVTNVIGLVEIRLPLPTAEMGVFIRRHSSPTPILTFPLVGGRNASYEPDSVIFNADSYLERVLLLQVLELVFYRIPFFRIIGRGYFLRDHRPFFRQFRVEFGE